MARRQDEPVDRLTVREREVLALMAEGRSNAAIAAARQVWRHALAILNDIGGSDVEPLRNKLASLTHRTPTEPAAAAGTFCQW